MPGRCLLVCLCGALSLFACADGRGAAGPTTGQSPSGAVAEGPGAAGPGTRQHDGPQGGQDAGPTDAHAAAPTALTVPRAAFEDAGTPESPMATPDDAGSEPARPTAAATDAGAPAAVTDQSLGTVAFRVETRPTPLASFGTLHVIAIWVEDATGRPIRLLGRWGAVSARALTNFRTRFAGVFDGGVPSLGAPADPADPDVVSAATQRKHQLREVHWDLRDRMGEPVPPGDYHIWVEVADSWEGTALTDVPFRAGPSPVEVMLSATTEFGPIELVYAPSNP